MEKVLVLISTYNGEKYLEEQLQSLYQQEGVKVDILVRDDGSSDATKEILQREQIAGKLTWYTGENLGPAKSFMNLVQKAPTYKYYAFCDQDDIWSTNKLISAIDMIREFIRIPAMYHSAVTLCDEDGNEIGKCGGYNHRGFLNGETRSVLGCTVVFNDELMLLLKKYNPKFFPMHDAWVHELCLAVDGKILYDDNSHMRYRQHGNNTVGAKQGLFNAIKRRLHFLYNRVPKATSKMLLEICENYSLEMPAENIARCKFVCSYDKSASNKLKVLADKKLFEGRLWWGMERRLLILVNKF